MNEDERKFLAHCFFRFYRTFWKMPTRDARMYSHMAVAELRRSLK